MDEKEKKGEKTAQSEAGDSGRLGRQLGMNMDVDRETGDVGEMKKGRYGEGT